MNSIKNSIEVVESFFSAINEGNFEQAKNYMADNHQYTGPMFSTNNPDEYFEKLMAFEMEFAVETQDMVVAKNAITHLSLLKIVNPVQATIPCCEVFNVEEGKITRQRFYFDTNLFPSN
ncbi:nuclear transport factor 2 family protein [Flavivirga spongiicola]|uniref:Nuclear transport factor 2 family protein n=1 Tax=Flavivirga spongiicola TaxID=421621 RepID=A0ABU7XX13_9FLAO|nr:nuclear transport factor 2 family protein [Flavivirga sp. MEBiC05379]MDO5979995.1 nuclear transport factor 2 family protein [Flavivirga sp. MEBiC05379]